MDAHPRTFGLFEKRIDGDDALWELARLRFQEARMGAELHADSSARLHELLRFNPFPDQPVMVHLPRDFNLASPDSRQRIAEFAAHSVGRVAGFIIHDHPDLGTRAGTFVEASEDLNRRLHAIARSPMVFIEYAAGLHPDVFAGFFEATQHLPFISACIDTGHVGIQQARMAYAAMHPGEDVCALKSEPAILPKVIVDVQAAVAAALPATLHLIDVLAGLGKPLHFHLHDGHPLSRFSPFGVSDHLSFLTEIPLDFEYQDRRSVPSMFGPAGLDQIIARVNEGRSNQLPYSPLRPLRPLREALPEPTSRPSRPAGAHSMTLEIHPTFERSPLGDAIFLFPHWRDLTHAEQMNHWLRTLQQNHELLVRSFEPTGSRSFTLG